VGLGFHLKKELIGVFLLFISFFGSFLNVAGCVKQPKDEVEFGPEYRRSEVAETLKMAIGESTPMDIKLNEFVQTDLTRVIRGRALIDLLETVGLTIVKREESESQLQINMVEERITYDLSDSYNNKKLIREFQDCMNKTTLRAENCSPALVASPVPTADPSPSVSPEPGVGSLPIVNSELLIEKSLKLMPQMSQDDSEESRTTYHQLKVTQRIIEPPKLVKEIPNCAGIPNCLINVTDIEFDQVNWLSYNKGDKIHVKITTSKAVPYMSRILEKCQQGSVPIKQEGKPEKDWPRLLVTFCETVRNFQKGE
jgi:hypothetical protein